MNINTWLEDIMQSTTRFSLPIMTHPGIEMIGCSVKEAVQNGEKHALAIKAVSDRFSTIAATSIMDLTVEAEAFGSEISFPENDMPHIHGQLVDASNIGTLKVPSLNSGRIPEYLKACGLAVQKINNKPFFAGVIGPFSLAGRLFGMSEIMINCYLETDVVKELLHKCTQFLISYCMELKSCGCSGIIIAEPAAGLLSNDDCLQFSSVYVRQIIETVQDDQFIIILHNCGNSGQCTNAMLYTKARGYHFGNSINMVETLKQCPKDVLVMGNIDPVGVLQMMTAADVEKEVELLLEQTMRFSNFILSTGCDVPPNVPIENINAFYNALVKFNKSNI